MTTKQQSKPAKTSLDRRAEALRENLRKRKLQVEQRKTNEKEFLLSSRQGLGERE
jgi:hypothetical protein